MKRLLRLSLSSSSCTAFYCRCRCVNTAAQDSYSFFPQTIRSGRSLYSALFSITQLSYGVKGGEPAEREEEKEISTPSSSTSTGALDVETAPRAKTILLKRLLLEKRRSEKKSELYAPLCTSGNVLNESSCSRSGREGVSIGGEKNKEKNSLDATFPNTSTWLRAFKLFTETVQQHAVIPTVQHINLLLRLAVEEEEKENNYLWNKSLWVEDFFLRFLTSTIELRHEKEQNLRSVLENYEEKELLAVAQESGNHNDTNIIRTYMQKKPPLQSSTFHFVDEPSDVFLEGESCSEEAVLREEIRELRGMELNLYPNRQTFDLLIQAALNRKDWRAVLRYYERSRSMLTSTVTEWQLQGLLKAIHAIGACKRYDADETHDSREVADGGGRDLEAAWGHLLSLPSACAAWPSDGAAAVRGPAAPPLWRLADDAFAREAAGLREAVTLCRAVELLQAAGEAQRVVTLYETHASRMLPDRFPSGLGKETDAAVLRTMRAASAAATRLGDWVLALELWRRAAGFTLRWTTTTTTDALGGGGPPPAFGPPARAGREWPVEGLVGGLLVNALHALRRVRRYREILAIYHAEKDRYAQEEGGRHAFIPPRAIVFVAQAAVATQNLPLLLEMIQLEEGVGDNAGDNPQHPAELYDATLRLIQIQSIQMRLQRRRRGHDDAKRTSLTALKDAEALSLRVYSAYVEKCMKAMEAREVYSACLYANAGNIDAGDTNRMIRNSWESLLTAVHTPLLSILYEIPKVSTPSLRKDQGTLSNDRDSESGKPFSETCPPHLSSEKIEKIQKDALYHFHAIRRPDMLVVALVMDILRRLATISAISEATADAILHIFSVTEKLPASLANITAAAVEFAYEALSYSHPFAALKVVKIGLNHGTLSPPRATDMVAGLQKKVIICLDIQGNDADLMNWGKVETPGKIVVCKKKEAGYAIANFMALSLICSDGYDTCVETKPNEIVFPFQEALLKEGTRQLYWKLMNKEKHSILKEYKCIVEEAAGVMHLLHSSVSLPAATLDGLIQRLCNMPREAELSCAPQNTQKSSFASPARSISIESEAVVTIIVNAILSIISIPSTAETTKRYMPWQQCLQLLQFFNSPFAAPCRHPIPEMATKSPEMHSNTRKRGLININQSTMRLVRVCFQQWKGADAEFVREMVLGWLLPRSHPFLLSLLPQIFREEEEENDFANIVQPPGIHHPSGMCISESVQLLFDAMQWACHGGEKRLVRELLARVGPFALEPLAQIPLTNHENDVFVYIDGKKEVEGRDAELQNRKVKKEQKLRQLQNCAIAVDVNLLQTLSSGEYSEVLRDWSLLRSSVLRLHHLASRPGIFPSSNRYYFYYGLLENVAMVLVKLRHPLICLLKEVSPRMTLCGKVVEAAKEYLVWSERLFLSQLLVPSLSSAALHDKKRREDGEEALEIYDRLLKDTAELLDASWEVLHLFFVWKSSFQCDEIDLLSEIKSDYSLNRSENQYPAMATKELAEHANSLLLTQGNLWNEKGISHSSASAVNLTKRVEIWCVLCVTSSNAFFSTSNNPNEGERGSAKPARPAIVERMCRDVVALDILYGKTPQVALHHHSNLNERPLERNGSKELSAVENLSVHNSSSISYEDSMKKCLIDESNEEERHLLRSLDLAAKSSLSDPYSHTRANSFTLVFIIVVHAITSYLVEEDACSKTGKDLKAIQFFQCATCARLRASELRTLHEAALRLCYVELCGYDYEGIRANNKRDSCAVGISVFLPWILAWAAPSETFYSGLLDAFNFFQNNKALGRQEDEAALFANIFKRIARVDQWYRKHAEPKDNSDHSVPRQAFLHRNGTFLLNYLLQRPPKKFGERGKELGRDLALRPRSLFSEALVAAAFVCLAPSLGVDFTPSSFSFSRNTFLPSFGEKNDRSKNPTPNPPLRTEEGEEVVVVANDNEEKKMFSLLLSFPLVLRQELLPLWRQKRLTCEQIAAIDRFFKRFLPSETPLAAPPTLRRMAITWSLATRGKFVNCSPSKMAYMSLVSGKEGCESGSKEEFETCLNWMNSEGERLFVKVLENRVQPPTLQDGQEDTSSLENNRLGGISLQPKTAPRIPRQPYKHESSALEVENLLKSVFTRGSAIEVLSLCFPEVKVPHSHIKKETAFPFVFSSDWEKEGERNSSTKGSHRQSFPALGVIELECLLSIAGNKLLEETKTELREINMRRNQDELQIGMNHKIKREYSSTLVNIDEKGGVYAKSEKVAPEPQNASPYWVNCVLRHVLQPNEHDDDHKKQMFQKAHTSIYAGIQHSSIHATKRTTPDEQLERILSDHSPLSAIRNEGIVKGSPPHQGLDVRNWKDIFHRIRAEVKYLQQHSRKAGSREVHLSALLHTQGNLNIRDQLETLILQECLDLYGSDKYKENNPPQNEEGDLGKEKEDALWRINSLVLCLDVIQKGRSLPFVMMRIYPLCSLAHLPQGSLPLAPDQAEAVKGGDSRDKATIRCLKKWCNFVQYHVYELLFETPLVERFSEQAMLATNSESAVEGIVSRPVSTPCVNAMQRASKEIAQVTRPLVTFIRFLALEGCLVELHLEKFLRQRMPEGRPNPIGKDENNKIDFMLRSLKEDHARIRSILRDLYAIAQEPIASALLNTPTSLQTLSFSGDNVVRSGLQTAILVGAWKDLRWICQRLLISRRARESNEKFTEEEMPLLTRLIPVSVAALFASLSRPKGCGSFSNELKSFAGSLVSPDQRAPSSPSCGFTEMDEKSNIAYTKKGTFEDFFQFLSELEQTLRNRIANATIRLHQEAHRQPRYVERLGLARPLHALWGALENFLQTTLNMPDDGLDLMQRFLSLTMLLIHPTHGAQFWNLVQQNSMIGHRIRTEQETHTEIAHVRTASLSEETVESAVSCLLTSSPSDYKAFRRLESNLPRRRRPETEALKQTSAPASNVVPDSIKADAGGKALQAAWNTFTDALLHRPELLPKATVLRVFGSLRHIPHSTHFIPPVLSEAVVRACPGFEEALEAVRRSLGSLAWGGPTAVQHHMLLRTLERLLRGDQTDTFSRHLDAYAHAPNPAFWGGRGEAKRGIVAVVCACHDLLRAHARGPPAGVEKGGKERGGGEVVPQHLLVLLLHAAVADVAVTRQLYALYCRQPYPRVEGVKVFLSLLRAARLADGVGPPREELAVRAMIDFLFLSSGILKVVRRQHGTVAPTEGVRQRRPRRFSAENHRVLWQAFVRTCRSGAVAETSASQIVCAYKSGGLIGEVEELLVNTSYGMIK